MPRIHPGVIRRAHSIDPLLARLLPICRDLPSSQRELRWMREHANELSKPSSLEAEDRIFHSYVRRRANGEPLQYILGSEFIGGLEIKCRPGVLIPRQETATVVTHLVSLLSSSKGHLPRPLRLLDLCTGSGCIPLHFQHEFYSKYQQSKEGQIKDRVLDVVGVDISPTAIALAKENQSIQLKALKSEGLKNPAQHDTLARTSFILADILREDTPISETQQPPPLIAALQAAQYAPSFDILISNPPYISPSAYVRSTSPSVRRYEPKLALVPPPLSSPEIDDDDGDLFYPHLLRAAHQVNAKVLLFEVADLEQAKRVAGLAVAEARWDGVEIWRDHPADASERSKMRVGGQVVPIRGSGNGRCVLAYRGDGGSWLGKG